jgi:hypothetical protein
VCIYFHSESSQKNTRMPELDTASHVVRLVRYHVCAPFNT